MWKSRLGKHQGKVKHCRIHQGLKLVNLFNLEASHKDQVFLSNLLAHSNLCALNNLHNSCLVSSNFQFSRKCSALNRFQISFLASRFLNSKLSN